MGSQIKIDTADFDRWLPALERISGACHTVMQPPIRLSVSEWADEYRRLSPEASEMPGRWNTNRTPYLREVMDAISDDRVSQVSCCFSTQVGKTEFVLNTLGFYMHGDPAPIMLLLPTDDLAEDYSKDRIATMIRDTPVLEALVGVEGSKTGGNTLLRKKFPGGHLTITGSNVASKLSARPIKIVLADELDRFARSAGKEGAPLALARKRQETFRRRKLVAVSSPTDKDDSPIWDEFEDGDQRYYHVPCPHCTEAQVLRWENVKWQNGDPETARYMCEFCGTLWSDAERWDAIRTAEAKGGGWRASKPFNGHASFHLWAAYSGWVRLSEQVAAFLAAQSDVNDLKVFVNTNLAELWEEKGDRADESMLQTRAEDYDADYLPEGVLVITAGVDTQDTRLEVEFVGWGLEGESWSLDYVVIHEDPSTRNAWQELDRQLKRRWSDGLVQIGPAAMALDTGGHHVQACYRYAKQKRPWRIYAIKGVGNDKKRPGAAPVNNPTRNNTEKIPLYGVDVNTFKDELHSRLQVTEPGENYQHFPTRYDEEHYKQLTAEKRVADRKDGRRMTKWVKTRPRNEALDCRVYNMAALFILRPHWSLLIDKLRKARAAAMVARDAAAPATADKGTRRGKGNRKGGWSVTG